MPSFTKRAIVESFLRLVGKKSLEKITVRDIVDDCGINRNTFYYYFQDIYAVLEEICHHFVEKLPAEESLSVTLSAFFSALGEFTEKYPRTARTLSISLGYDGLERYFAADMDRVILSCLLRETKNSTPSRDYLLHLTSFLRHALFGFCIDLLRSDHPQNFDQARQHLADILGGVAATLGEKDSDKS